MEKAYESLMTREEISMAVDHDEYFSVPPDLRDLNYSNFTDRGEKSISDLEDYTTQYKLTGYKWIIKMLNNVPYIEKMLKSMNLQSIKEFS